MALAKIQSRGQITLPRAIRQSLGLMAGDIVSLRSTAPDTVELKVLPRLSLADLLERYPIEGPINEAADREQWEEKAARDVLGERSE